MSFPQNVVRFERPETMQFGEAGSVRPTSRIMLWVDFTVRNQRVKGIEPLWLFTIERRRLHRM